MTSPAERIIEQYKKSEHVRITGAIHAATALAGAALYKNETGGNEFLFVLAILLSASAYGFWYLTELAHARTALWALEKQADMELIRKQRLFQLGLTGQWATFLVLVVSFACSIVGLTFEFVLSGPIGLERSDASFVVFIGLIVIAGAVTWFFSSVMATIRTLNATQPLSR